MEIFQKILLGHTPRVIQPRRSVGAEQSVRVCVFWCFGVRVSRYPFGVRRTPWFCLGDCVPAPRAVFCLRILFAWLVVEPSMPISLACMLYCHNTIITN
jgi:hypothetical protein